MNLFELHNYDSDTPLTVIAQQELSSVLGGSRGNDSDLDGVGVGQVDVQLVVIAVDGRCASATHRHAVAAVQTLLDHRVHLHAGTHARRFTPKHSVTTSHTRARLTALCPGLPG